MIRTLPEPIHGSGMLTTELISASYIGYFSEAETFDENFGGNTTCFNVTSSSGTSSIYTETFSVAFKMNSTRNGLYIADLGSDDGSRLTVDGNFVIQQLV